ncbi:hypothetical protein Syun_002070 [Stephania yunnanensis]|uniref:RING-type E3 ubiquitin transferase BRCA1 n=1 Tax=Stephania yunnanensis TaxID=152371 RepID=A0AAP0Q734_9MAGN
MESVIATVSGYHGLERFKLIKLINYTGASYVGSLTKSTTHLVCWRFEGRKYDMANEFGTIIISHRWFEDCAKAGKCLPEDPYIMQSGQQVGILSWEVPVIGETKQKTNKLFGETNTFAPSKMSKAHKRCVETGSILLSEKQNDASSTSCCLPSARSKRNFSSKGPALEGERTRKRRLVKNVCSDSSETIMLDSEQQFFLNEICNQRSGAAAADNSSSSNGNESDMLCTEQKIKPAGSCLIPNNVTLSDVPGHLKNKKMHVSNSSNTLSEDVQPQKTTSNSACSDIEKNMEAGFGKSEEINRISSATELSCVICWTDFSPTRGVLPCGHRFCYSCIQDWADHMAINRKASTCPLCKAYFTSIIKVDGAASFDQKIYSQTVPCDSLAADIFVLPDFGITGSTTQSSATSVCCKCRSREPEDLLVRCHLCLSRWVHSYCLDPPVSPWTCAECMDLRMLYQRFH